MNNQPNYIWNYAGVTVFSVIGTACAIMVIAQLPNWGDKKAEWVGALGTVAAFAGTIWIATSEARRRRRDERTRAQLQAAAMAYRITSVVLRIEELSRKLHEFFDLQDAEKSLNYCKYVNKTLEELSLWTVDETALLVPLANNTAGRLAQTLDEIHRIKSICTAAIRHKLGNERSRKICFETLEGNFLVTLNVLKFASEECKKSRFIQDRTSRNEIRISSTDFES